MKKNKIIIIVLVTILIFIGCIYLLVNNKDDLTANSKNIIGENDTNKSSYGYPFIKWAYCDDLNVTIVGGIYRFGDIDKDGLIGYSDFQLLKQMITTGGYNFGSDSKKLADVNEDGNINNGDLKIFNEYLKKNNEVEYDFHEELLLYCLNSTNDSSRCNWQDDSSFKIKEIKNYYAFVKHKNNGKVSNFVLVPKEEIK